MRQPQLLEFQPFEAVDCLMAGRFLQKMIADIKKVTTEEALKEKHAQLMAAIPRPWLLLAPTSNNGRRGALGQET